MNNLRPIKRSKLRITMGKLFYTSKRCIEWCVNGKKYAKVKNRDLFPITVFQHNTPLLRKLQSVDMWMQYNKIENLRIAIKSVNNIIIQPGETFSYWRLIGNPTKRKGYKEGMVLFYGGFKPGVGGGLCQLSNLIYWITLHTPLTVVERYRHSYDVFPDSDRTQPFGSGATCAYNYIDLQIYNDTNILYQINLYLADGYLHGEWRALEQPDRTYEVYESRHWITHELWGGYVRHNEIRRKVYSTGKVVIDDQYITENHAIMMYQPYLSEAKTQPME